MTRRGDRKHQFEHEPDKAVGEQQRKRQGCCDETRFPPPPSLPGALCLRAMRTLRNRSSKVAARGAASDRLPRLRFERFHILFSPGRFTLLRFLPAA